MLQEIKQLFRTDYKYPVNGYGFIDAVPEPLDYVLGAENQALKIILSEDRDYSDYLPPHETQIRGFDSYACVSFSANNNLEILYKRQYGEGIDWSDRYTASMSDTRPGYGNTFKRVADSIRHNGLVLEEEYSWGGKNGYEYVEKPNKDIIEKGKAQLMKFDIEYEWIDWGGCDPDKLYDALLYGPLQVSVSAAATRTGKRDTNINHAVTIYKAVKGKEFYILDHYRHTYAVPWNFYFGSAMRFSMLKKKMIPLVMVVGAPEIYAIFGDVACHISNEATWKYGEEIGIWNKTVRVIGKQNFQSSYIIGKSLTIK